MIFAFISAVLRRTVMAGGPIMLGLFLGDASFRGWRYAVDGLPISLAVMVALCAVWQAVILRRERKKRNIRFQA